MSSSDRNKIVAIMKENSSHAYLATCDEDQPVVRPISPIVEDDMSVWVITFDSSRKVKQIRQNPRICLAFVEHPAGEKAATVLGRAEIVDSLDEKKRIWSLVSWDPLQFFPDGPTSDELCLLKIATEKIEWRESQTSGENIYEPAQK